MAVTLHGQAMITVDEALTYLQDQGNPTDDFDLLKTHINAVTAFMLTIMGRDRMKWVDADAITEYRNGDGAATIWLRNAPIVEVTSLTLEPNWDTSTAVAVPTGGATYSDEMFFDARAGSITLKSRVFPRGPSSTKIVYEAGFVSTDAEYLGLKMVTLDALATKWQRWKNQKHGVESESRGDQQITYTDQDFTANAMKDLRRYRRNLFA